MEIAVQYNHFMRVVVLVALLLSAACVPVAGATIPAPQNLQPYATVTPSTTPASLTGLIASSPAVLPSPTPFEYAVKSGDTLGGIAEKFNVDLDALMLANPGVDPNAMHIGETLNIPSNQRNTSGESTPTPAPFSVQQVTCRPTADRGLWCFALAHNESSDLMEDISVQMTLLDPSGQAVGSQTALLPLDILPPGASLPLSAYFPPGVASGVTPQVQVLTAIRLLPGDQRYLPAAVQNTSVLVDASGLSAQVNGQIVLPADSKPAAKVWVAAVLYDADGMVAGVRRWEWTGTLAPGDSLPFSFPAASLAGPINRVDFAVEARP